MENIKQYSWEIVSENTPLLKKKCSKCKSNSHFYCSNKFRLNSQKRYIDVWLIYRCVECDETYNLTILSRTKPELIDKDLYHRFMMNDEATVWQYAFDSDIIARNNIEADYSDIRYEIVREDISLEKMDQMEEDRFVFTINMKYNLNLKLTSVIRECFEISLNQLDKMLQAGVISIFPVGAIKKYKVKNDVKIEIDGEKLKKYLNKCIV
ncbi:MAG: DUF1062 domain-containing protein [Dysgonomonas sp.]|nr:DUF1062 domain-containing protein [Dysgonomonas sp.]